MKDDGSDKRDAEASVAAMQGLRDFPHNTCPSSRHGQMIAEDMVVRGTASLYDIDPVHAGASIASAVGHLYAARTMLSKLGYTWSVQDGVPVWTESGTMTNEEAS